MTGKSILLLATLIFFLITGYFYRSHIFATRFVDEEYNFAIGKYLLKGEKLYDDIITNHNPVAHILSALVQQITRPTNSYLLIRNHRLAIFAWSAGWSLLLVYYFGSGALLFTIIFELTKGYIFGNLFLAESLVVYPLIFLMGLVLQKKFLSKSLMFLAGVSLSLCGLLFGPLMPLLIFIILCLIYQQGNYVRFLKFLSLGILSVILGILKFTSIPEYIYYYLYINLTYTVPNYRQAYYADPWIITIGKSFITPILAFLRSDNTPTLIIIRILVILLAINLIALKTKKWSSVFLIVIILGLANLRFVNPGNEHFAAGFLPWYCSLIFISSFYATVFLKKGGFLKTVNIILISLSLIFTINFSLPLIFSKRDPILDFSINYSTQTDRGEAIRIMRGFGDTIFASPDNWLVYWQSDTNHLPKLFGYYPWMSGIPTLHRAILNQFEKNPPTFIYCENCKSLDLEKYLSKYIELEKNNQSSDIFVLKSKTELITKDQKVKLDYYNFSF